MVLRGWPLGIFFCILASVFGILGKIMLKLSYNNENAFWFWFGMCFVVVVNPLLVASAYDFAPQSLLAPMGGLTIVWNSILSPKILNEEITSQDIIGAGLIFCGCVLVGISGGHTIQNLPINELPKHFTSAQFIVYMIFVIILCATLLHFASPVLLRSKKSLNEKQHSHCCRISLAALAGTLSGQMFFLTAFVRILHDGSKILLSFSTYLIGFGALFFAVSGLYLLNIALRLYDAVFVIYIYEAMVITFGAISGLCFFNEMLQLSTWHYIIYTISLIQILIGIFVLSKHPDHYQIKQKHQDMEAKEALL